MTKLDKVEKGVVNSPEWRQKIKDHIAFYTKIQELGVIGACEEGVIKKVGISISGGKDSVATLLWAKDNLGHIEGLDIQGYYADTPLENIDIKQYIDYLTQETGIKINVIGFTKQEYDEQLDKLVKGTIKSGPPFTIRLCTVHIKGILFERINNICDINLVGVRWKESELRKNVSKLYRMNFQIYYHPIIKFSKQDVFNSIKDHNIKLYWSYKYADRLGCSMCPLGIGKKNPKELYYIINSAKSIDWNFYDKWFVAIKKFKYDRSKQQLISRHNHLISNYMYIKREIKLGNTYKIKEFDVPNCGWFHPE